MQSSCNHMRMHAHAYTGVTGIYLITALFNYLCMYIFSPKKFPTNVCVNNQQVVHAKAEQACSKGIIIEEPQEDTYDSGSI